MSVLEKWKHLRISLAKIKEATNNFQKEIGKGGYGSVYLGKLSINGQDRKLIAVKRLNEESNQGLKEFLNEIDLLAGKQHENLIALVGFCDEKNEKIIVYEYSERGSLDLYFRYGNNILTWPQRLKIVVDVAKALDHLHHHLQNKEAIIHRDIKASNILIDQNWVAKISDFGLSKSTVTDLGRSTVVTYACGTAGYVEPELKQYFTANPKSDVYSFGMLLFEVLCGRLCNIRYGDHEILTAEVVEKYYTNDKLDDIIDPSLREQMNPIALRRFAVIAFKCLQRREQRPHMYLVKKELEETLKIQVSNSTLTRSMSRMNPNNLKIPLEDIKYATNGFRKLIGRGGYGSMYEGEVSVLGIKTKVAVKRLTEEFGQGRREFLTEIQALLFAHHENVVPLVGYCDEGNEMITVYEYAKHGTLDRYIEYSETGYTLTWLQRLKIVVDVARGLDHLHNHLQMNRVIIHRDIKCFTIMLHGNWVAKICDFGLSIFADPVRCEVATAHCGTYRYVEPECLSSNVVTTKSDVFSFGMVLFEVLCGRLCYRRDDDGILLLPEVAKEYYADVKLDRIIHPTLKEQMSQESLNKFSAIAYKCLQPRKQRPLIHVVKKELEETLQTEVHHWRKLVSKNWYILHIENVSPEIEVEMEHKETEGIKNISI